MKFPYECSRCGVCCLMETCQFGITSFKISRETPCPALSFSVDGEAICSLAESIVPIGDGCCLRARALRNNV